jgi:hypothetical protein
MTFSHLVLVSQYNSGKFPLIFVDVEFLRAGVHRSMLGLGLLALKQKLVAIGAYLAGQDWIQRGISSGTVSCSSRSLSAP